MNKDQIQDIASRAACVLRESEHADEHAELIVELEALSTTELPWASISVERKDQTNG